MACHVPRVCTVPERHELHLSQRKRHQKTSHVIKKDEKRWRNSTLMTEAGRFHILSAWDARMRMPSACLQCGRSSPSDRLHALLIAALDSLPMVLHLDAFGTSKQNLSRPPPQSGWVCRQITMSRRDIYRGLNITLQRGLLGALGSCQAPWRIRWCQALSLMSCV